MNGERPIWTDERVWGTWRVKVGLGKCFGAASSWM
ncbi:MAG: hypothetical protein BKPUNTRY_000160 [Candidatus Fervidibacter sp.]